MMNMHKYTNQMLISSSKSKSEDTVQCSIFSIAHCTGDKLDELCQELNDEIAVLSKNYIWHRDEFKFCVSVLDKDKIGMPAHLTSTVCFGDNIDDEWFIVYLVLHITSKRKDLVAHIEDNDGDFILIEAANFLPSWANPDNTELRVFLYQGKIHIIPLEVIDFNSDLNLQNAINLIIQKPDETKASKEIQEAVLNRIITYPQNIADSHHRALVTLPIDIAALLTLKPSLISHIATTYCNHDIVDAKCFKDVKFNNCVTIPVLFTKYLYAMLLHSKLPRIGKQSNISLNKKEESLGCKLACGYEIIMSNSSKDIFKSHEYNKFLTNLTSNGYFKNNIEGSKQYNELLDKAKNYFYNIECPLNLYNLNIISNLMNTEQFIKLKHSLQNNEISNKSVDDNEEWLNINPDELNTFLNTHYGKNIIKNQDSIAPQITSDLSNFLKQTSDFEGIEYMKEEESEENQIEFDSDQFITCVQKMLQIVTGEKKEGDDNESDFSEDEFNNLEEDLDIELTSKLQNPKTNSSNEGDIIKNLLQSIKEEGSSGPSSTLLKNVGIYETELDSDDD